MAVLKNIAVKLGCHGCDNVDVQIWGKLVKTWTVLKLFNFLKQDGEWGLQKPPVLTGLKGSEKISNPSDSFTKWWQKVCQVSCPGCFAFDDIYSSRTTARQF